MTSTPDRVLPHVQGESRSTRENVLDAAEALFASRGYEGTSMNEIGAAAGLSRGTPGYFFGSKADLYQAVLERCMAQVRQAVHSGRARALASGESPATILAGVVSEYFDFITAHPHFVRLIEWEALTGGSALEALPPHLEVAHEALSALREEVVLDSAHPEDATHLLLSVVGLCWFPLVHSGTLLRALGVDPTSAEFLQERKRHVIDLVLSGSIHRSSPRLSPREKNR